MKKPKKGIPWSIERKEDRRRMNLARRLWKRFPLFALNEMQEEYPGYTEIQLKDDLRRRTPEKKMKGKSQLIRYGRFQKIEDLMREFNRTGNVDFAIIAAKLRLKITKPYILNIPIGDEMLECRYHPKINYRTMMDFYRKAKHCGSREALEQLEKEMLKYAHLG